MKFDGVITPRRRGGWNARGVAATERAGQLFETQIGPMEFATRAACAEWLQQAAAKLAIANVRIIDRPGR